MEKRRGRAICLTRNYSKGSNPEQTLKYQKRSIVAEPIAVNTTADGKAQCLRATYKSPTLTASMSRQTSSASIFFILNADGKQETVYCVHNGQITIKDKQYPTKLKDGFYIIRKLSVKEACRLQTLPDDYCKAVSNTQAYKAIGNGWTVDVVAHILSNIKEAQE